MKLKNIALGIGFLATMFSCSMEDEIQSGMDNEGIASEQYAYFDFSLMGSNGLNTKTQISSGGMVEAAESEAKVANCFVAVLSGDNVLASRYYDDRELQVDEDDYACYRLGKHILVKVPAAKPELKCFAVANVVDKEMENALIAATTSTQLAEIAVNGSLEAGKLVKVGTATLSDYTTTPKTIHDVDEVGNEQSSIGGVACNEVAIQVAQRAAAIEFTGFSLVKKNETTNNEEVLEASDLCLELIHVNTQTALAAAGSPLIQDQSSSAGISTDEKVERLYMYENATEKKTSFRVHYTAEGKEKMTNVFTIKTPQAGGHSESVAANHLYKVTVKVVNELVDVEVQCTTADWVKNCYELGEISVETTK